MSASRPIQAALGVLLVVFAGVVASGINRPGYSIDEEFTLFAVKGIQQRGVPILPSGVLENRGLPYTYSAWLAGLIVGDGLPAYRYPSLIAGVVSVALVFRLASIALPQLMALLATIAVALLPWQILSAEWARFYSMFVACYLASLLLFWRFRQTGRGRAGWLASIALAHMLHDFAITLVLLPAVVTLVGSARRPLSRPGHLTMLALATFLGVDGLLYVVHLTTSDDIFRTFHGFALLHAPFPVVPVGWEPAMGGALVTERSEHPLVVRLLGTEYVGAAFVGAGVLGAVGAWLAHRLRLPGVLGGLGGVLAGLRQFARLWFVTAMWLFIRPVTAVKTALWALVMVLVGAVALAIAESWRAGSELSLALIRSLATYALGQLSTVVWGVLYYHPLSSAVLVVAGVLLALRPTSASLMFPRTMFLLLLCWLLLFDVLGVEFKPRYYVAVWPLIVVVALHLPHLVPARFFGRLRTARIARSLLGIAIVAGLTWEQYRVEDENRTARCVAGGFCAPQMVGYDASAASAIAHEIQPTDIVLCTDELACHYLVGRTDYWLYPGTIFAYPTDHGVVGLFGGTPVIQTLPQLTDLFARDPARQRYWIVLPALRKYPTWTAEEIVNAMPSALEARIHATRTAGVIVLRTTS